MKVFFTASPRILESEGNSLRTIFNEIENLGHDHLSRLVIENNVEAFYKYDEKQRIDYLNATTNHIKKADVIVMEATIHSLASGYILEKSLNLNKQVILLHKKGKEPFFFTGIENDNLQIIDYIVENVPAILKEAFDYATTQQDIRFNMLISPKISNYLSDISEKDNVSKASFIRQLIKNHMKSKN